MKAKPRLVGFVPLALLVSVTIGASETAVSRVEVRSNSLGWGGIHLGASRAAVQTALARTLSVKPTNDLPACGDFESADTLYGHTIRVQWSAESAAGIVESINVSLSSAEAKTPASEIAREIQSRSPGLVIDASAEPSRAAQLHLPSNPDQVLLIKAGNEHQLILSLKACLD